MWGVGRWLRCTNANPPCSTRGTGRRIAARSRTRQGAGVVACPMPLPPIAQAQANRRGHFSRIRLGPTRRPNSVKSRPGPPVRVPQGGAARRQPHPRRATPRYATLRHATPRYAARARAPRHPCRIRARACPEALERWQHGRIKLGTVDDAQSATRAMLMLCTC